MTQHFPPTNADVFRGNGLCLLARYEYPEPGHVAEIFRTADGISAHLLAPSTDSYGAISSVVVASTETSGDDLPVAIAADDWVLIDVATGEPISWSE